MTIVDSAPVLACYDGSEGSRGAMRRGSHLLGRRVVTVLTVWEPLEVQLRRVAAFASLAPTAGYGDFDTVEEAAARQAAEDGAAHAAGDGLVAEARVARCEDAIWRTILDTAQELNVAGILLGSRGRGRLRSELLGSTAHNVLNHAACPVLVVPHPVTDAPD